MEFGKELRDDIVAGDITLTFRLWRRPQATVGGRCRVGEPDRETLRRRAAHAGPIAEDTLLYRIAFHVVG